MAGAGFGSDDDEVREEEPEGAHYRDGASPATVLQHAGQATKKNLALSLKALPRARAGLKPLPRDHGVWALPREISAKTG